MSTTIWTYPVTMEGLRTPGLISLLFLPGILAIAPASRSMIEVPFCCSEAETVEIKSRTSAFGWPIVSGSCVEADFDNHEILNQNQTALEWEQILVVDTAKSEDAPGRKIAMNLKKLEEMEVDCSNGLVLKNLKLHTKGSSSSGSSSSSEIIRLDGGGHSTGRSTSGYVKINGQPVCDDGWGTEEATVACRMLGFTGGRPTSNTPEPLEISNFIMDDVKCKGHETSLFDCEYNYEHDCSISEAAGVYCFSESSSTDNFLTMEGNLQTESGELVPAGEFCLAWTVNPEQTEDPYYRSYHSPYSQRQPKTPTLNAVQCHQKSNKVIYTLLEMFFRALVRRGEEYVQVDRPPFSHFITFADKNNDKKLDKDEFNTFFIDNLRELFDIFDPNGNGVIDLYTETAQPLKGIPFKLLEKIFVKAFKLGDVVKKDNLLSLEDDAHLWVRFNMRYVDKDNDGKISIGDLIGYPPITWPYPLYRLYARLDVDQREDISFKELTDFLETFFGVFNTDGDCNISTDEIVNVLNRLELPDSYGLSAQILLQQYFTLINYILSEFLQKADTDTDGKTTFDEILNFDDWDWIEESVVPIAINFGYPNMGPAYILAGQDTRMWYGPRRPQNEDERIEKIFARWLEALDRFLDDPSWSAQVKHCKVESI